MKRASLLSTGLAVIALVALAGSTLAAGAFANGSFESGSYVPSNPYNVGYETLVAGSSNVADMTGWTVTSGSVDWIGPGTFSNGTVVTAYWQAEDGSFSLDMSGNGPGAISQTFATDPNAHYTVRVLDVGQP